ncbi:MAG: methyltransferase domain-containing protein [Nitrospiraceae bacterium]
MNTLHTPSPTVLQTAESVSSELIRWLPATDSRRTCYLCRTVVSATAVLDVQNPFEPAQPLHLYRCRTCTSAFYDPFYLVPKERYYSARLMKYVSETVRGLDNFVMHLSAAAPDNRRRSLLDLGCGLGLSVDFARRCLGWDAVGIEPSPWGEIGRRAFQIPMYDRYLQEIDALKGKQFGLVYVSEVIEHVPDPTALLAGMSEHVTDDGMLLVTTPNAERLGEQATLAEYINILAPADHILLFTPASLRATLMGLGFQHITMLKADSQLVCCASKQALAIHHAAYPPSAWRPVYLEYLQEIARQPIPEARLHLGLTFRLCAELMQDGRFADARVCLDELCADLCARGDAVLLDPQQATAIVRALPSSHAFIDRCPGHLAGLHYFLGLYAAQVEHRYDLAQAHLQASFDIAAHCLTFGLEYFAEDADRIWDAAYQLGLCQRQAGLLDDAIRTFERLAKPDVSSGLPPVRADLQRAGTYYLAEALTTQGRWDEAIPYLRRVMRMELRLGGSVCGERSAELLGRATGTVLAQELDAMSDRHAVRQCQEAFRGAAGSRLSRWALWTRTAQEAWQVVASQGLEGILTRIRSRLS